MAGIPVSTTASSALCPISVREGHGLQSSSSSSPGLIPAAVLAGLSLTTLLQAHAAVHSPLWFASALSSILGKLLFLIISGDSLGACRNELGVSFLPLLQTLETLVGRNGS